MNDETGWLLNVIRYKNFTAFNRWWGKGIIIATFYFIWKKHNLYHSFIQFQNGSKMQLRLFYNKSFFFAGDEVYHPRHLFQLLWSTSQVTQPRPLPFRHTPWEEWPPMDLLWTKCIVNAWTLLNLVSLAASNTQRPEHRAEPFFTEVRHPTNAHVLPRHSQTSLVPRPRVRPKPPQRTHWTWLAIREVAAVPTRTTATWSPTLCPPPPRRRCITCPTRWGWSTNNSMKRLLMTNTKQLGLSLILLLLKSTILRKKRTSVFF